MTVDEHLIAVGKVVGNLQAAEHVLRIFLCFAAGETVYYPTPDDAEVPLTSLTDYDPLNRVIARYNNTLTSAEQQYRVDLAIVRTRDALAHGRLISFSGAYPLTLVKYGTPQGQKVPVEYQAVIDSKWLDDQRDHVRKQIDLVVTCAQARGYQIS